MEYVRLLAIILFISIAGNMAYAQEQPNTVITTLHPNASRFNPTELRQIFDIDYGAFGSVRLSTAIRGIEFPQGEAYGLITAVPSQNKININGHYSLTHDDISISIKGDIVVKKAISPEIYPRIVLNSGTMGINGIIIQCFRPGCRYININSETGWLKISGEADIAGRGSIAASITGREELITTITEEDMLIEQTLTALISAKNINIKPKQTEENTLIGLILKTEPTQDQIDNEDRPQIGRFTLIEANNAGYVLLKEPPFEQLVGNAKVFSIISPDDLENQEFFTENYPMLVHNGRNDIILYASQTDSQQLELFRLKSGEINYGIREGVGYPIGEDARIITCSDRQLSCLYFYQNGKAELKFSKRQRGPPVVGLMNLDSGWVSSINLKPFEISDTESKLIVKKPSSLGTRSMVFTKDEIIVDGNWEDFGISFSGYIFNQIENRYKKLECIINEHQCYLDGRPISSIRQTSQRCNGDEDCGEGICRSNRCIEARSCTRIVGNDDPTKIDLLIAGEGFDNIEEVQEIAIGRDGLGGLIYGPDGLFNIEPFSRYRHRFNIWIQITPTASTRSGGYGIELHSIRDLNCPEANTQLILSKRDFRSHASFELERCILSLPDAPRNRVFMHEFGHCFGHLGDEYYTRTSNRAGYPVPPNCIAPQEDKGVLDIAEEEWSQLLCNRNSNCDEATRIVEQEARVGCGGDCDERCENYLRPSQESIMRHSREFPEFNKISEAWLEKKIRAWS